MKNNVERIVRQINPAYYAVYTLTILSTMIGFYLTRDRDTVPDVKSEMSITLSSIVILYVIVSIPAALYLFQRNLKKWKQIEDMFFQHRQYIAGARLRLLVVGAGLVGSIIVHFILFAHTSNISMLATAGISAVGLFFCKPSYNKVANELEIEDEE
jgi:hypothetical protein